MCAARPWSSRRRRYDSSSYAVSRMSPWRNRARAAPSSSTKSASSSHVVLVGARHLAGDQRVEIPHGEAPAEHRRVAEELTTGRGQAIDLRGHERVDRVGERVTAAVVAGDAEQLGEEQRVPVGASDDGVEQVREQRIVFGRASERPARSRRVSAIRVRARSQRSPSGHRSVARRVGGCTRSPTAPLQPSRSGARRARVTLRRSTGCPRTRAWSVR